MRNALIGTMAAAAITTGAAVMSARFELSDLVNQNPVKNVSEAVQSARQGDMWHPTGVATAYAVPTGLGLGLIGGLVGRRRKEKPETPKEDAKDQSSNSLKSRLAGVGKSVGGGLLAWKAHDHAYTHTGTSATALGMYLGAWGAVSGVFDMIKLPKPADLILRSPAIGAGQGIAFYFNGNSPEQCTSYAITVGAANLAYEAMRLGNQNIIAKQIAGLGAGVAAWYFTGMDPKVGAAAFVVTESAKLVGGITQHYVNK